MGRKAKAPIYVGRVNVDRSLKRRTIIMLHNYKTSVIDRKGNFIISKFSNSNSTGGIILSTVKIISDKLTTDKYFFNSDSDIYISEDIADKLGLNSNESIYQIRHESCIK